MTKVDTTYTVTFVGAKSNTNVAQLKGDVFVTGTLPRAASPGLLALSLGSHVTTVLANAGLGFAKVATGIDATGHLTISPTGSALALRFVSPIKAEGGSRVSLTTPDVPLTYDPTKAAVQIDRRIEINVVHENSSFQELGLTTAPTRFDFTTDVTDPIRRATHAIEFTLFVNGKELLVEVPSHNDLSRLDNLVTELQTAIDAALVSFGFAAGDVKACRVNPNPSVSPTSPRRARASAIASCSAARTAPSTSSRSTCRASSARGRTARSPSSASHPAAARRSARARAGSTSRTSSSPVTSRSSRRESGRPRASHSSR